PHEIGIRVAMPAVRVGDEGVRTVRRRVDVIAPGGRPIGKRLPLRGLVRDLDVRLKGLAAVGGAGVIEVRDGCARGLAPVVGERVHDAGAINADRRVPLNGDRIAVVVDDYWLVPGRPAVGGADHERVAVAGQVARLPGNVDVAVVRTARGIHGHVGVRRGA